MPLIPHGLKTVQQFKRHIMHLDSDADIFEFNINKDASRLLNLSQEIDLFIVDAYSISRKFRLTTKMGFQVLRFSFSHEN